jgi:hypothetical protein
VQDLSRVRIAWYNSATRAYKYRIDISDNGSSYSTVVDNTANSTYGDTTDTFSAAGRYVRIYVTGANAGWAGFYECRIESAQYVPTNMAPTVYAGLPQTVYVPDETTLVGNAIDDGFPNPPATLTTTWSKLSGPGEVIFGDAHSLFTTASFSQSGLYELQLTGDDGEKQATSSLEVSAFDRPSISMAMLPPDAIHLVWSANEGSEWQLQYVTNLLDPNWEPVSNTPVTAPVDLPINPEIAPIFYRLKLQ